MIFPHAKLGVSSITVLLCGLPLHLLQTYIQAPYTICTSHPMGVGAEVAICVLVLPRELDVVYITNLRVRTAVAG